MCEKIRRLANRPLKAAKPKAEGRGRGGRGRGGKGRGGKGRGGKGRGSKGAAKGQSPAGTEPIEPAPKRAKKGRVNGRAFNKIMNSRSYDIYIYAGLSSWLQIDLQERTRLSQTLPKLARYRES